MSDSDCEFRKVHRRSRQIELSEWEATIARLDYLEPMPDRSGKNPFTQEEIVFSGTGKALYKRAGENLGNASLVDGVIATTGLPKELCEEIATSLEAICEADDRS